ncbi:hypothetical protein RI367_006891 [Sorochytrium milnesiophthora]
MKQRYSALDVHAVSTNLQRLVGMRLQNVYDVNQKTYLLKFAKPDQKELLLIESGIRLHTTQFAREKPNHPSQFAMKLRKHLRTRRLTAVRQLGVDRIVDLEFAGATEQGGFHVIAEFYAAGNLILTDNEYTILQLLRTVKVDGPTQAPAEEEQMEEQPATNNKQGKKQQKGKQQQQQQEKQQPQKVWAVGEKYDIDSYQRLTQLAQADLVATLRAAQPKDRLKKVLASATVYGGPLIEHCLLRAGMTPDAVVATDVDSSNDSHHVQLILAALAEAHAVYTQSTPFEGYVISTQHEQSQDDQAALSTFEDFQPILFDQVASKPHTHFPTFDAAADTYFSQLESQKLDIKARQVERTALRKLDSIRREQVSRVQQLEQAQLTNAQKAQLIEANLELVEQALAVIRSALANGVDWVDLEKMVAEETRHGNPIASSIAQLKLDTNQITLLLRDPFVAEDYGFSDSDDEGDDVQTKQNKPVRVDIDISLSGYANARRLYDAKKQSAIKQQKTLAVSQKALKNAELKIQQDLKQSQVAVSINKIRKPYWFEKFVWFVSSEDYLVIAGRDMQQNEQLVKRHLRAGDVYVHADLHGAPSVIIKNRAAAVTAAAAESDAPAATAALPPPPPSTLAQAGCLAVCLSRAWDSKIVTSAWWVYDHQVSKSAPTGEYLTTGSFMIRGKKNFLPPTQLVYGFGFLFKVDESSMGRHVGERRPGYLDDAAEGQQQDEEQEQEVVEDQEEEEEEEEAEKGKRTAGSLLEQMQQLQLQAQEATSDSESSSSSDDNNDEDENGGAAQVPETDKPAEWSKYELDQPASAHDTMQQLDDQQDGGDADLAPAKTKRYISAKQRRTMRKKTAGGAEDDEESESKPAGKQAGAGKNAPSAATPTAQVRGKKGKQKKLKSKYADQDDEDRELALAMLGSDKGPQPKGKKAKKEAAKKVEAVAQQRAWEQKKAQEQQQKQQQQQQEESVPEPDANAEEQPEEAEGEDAEEIKRMLEEENVALLDADSAVNLTELDALTGQPHPDDIILFAVPVCAPYSTLQKYKYKVKLTPGSMKKGKAAKLALQVFGKHPDATPREREVLKSVPEMEMIAVMLGKVKVSAAQLEAVKKGKGGKGGR